MSRTTFHRSTCKSLSHASASVPTSRSALGPGLSDTALPNRCLKNDPVWAQMSVPWDSLEVQSLEVNSCAGGIGAVAGVLSPSPKVIDVLDPAGAICRDRMRQLLEALDGGQSIDTESLLSLVEETTCQAGHPARAAALSTPFFEESSGEVRATAKGKNWLVEAGRPATEWTSQAPAGQPPLRTWQSEALDSWAGHGRIGVVEAVTGTGKSRVGVEAVREALADDYSVVIVVPTRELVQQWCATLRAHRIDGVASVGDGVPPRFGPKRRVLVGTVQSLYPAPPWRADGKVLIVADECHRYGSEQWKRILHSTYRRRLGLTATFERNDDGLGVLLRYFGGTPCFQIGFDRAIADGVVAHYDVKLLKVRLSPSERTKYDAAHETVIDCRLRLIDQGVPEEPFGLFMKVVSEYSRGDDSSVPAMLVDLSRRYLKNFHERTRILSESRAKLRAARALAPSVHRSQGALVFTRSILAAENIAEALREEAVASEPIHSNLTTFERRERLHRLKIGRTRALVAPTVLDEGIDVPQIDLGIVMGGSKSRRQMIQRMGRVLRLKSDGRRATFVVVYAEGTVEDITQNDGQEGCLDLIVQSADSVTHIEADAQFASRRKSSTPSPTSSPQAASADHQISPEDSTGGTAGRRAKEAPTPTLMPKPRQTSAPATSVPASSRVEATPKSVFGEAQATSENVDPRTLPMTRAALVSYQRVHGGDDAMAESALRETLAGLLRIARPTSNPGPAGSASVRAAGLTVLYAKDRFQSYFCARQDKRSWAEVSRQWQLTKVQRLPGNWRHRPWPDSPTRRNADAALAGLGSANDLAIADRAVEEHIAMHGGGRTESEQHLRLLVDHLGQDRDRNRCEKGRLVIARSGYSVEIDIAGRQVVGYKSSGQYRRYGDYLEFGRADDPLKKISMAWNAPDTVLDVRDLAEFREVVDPSTIFYSNRTFERLTESVRFEFLNSWDADRYVRYLIDSDLSRAEPTDLRIGDDSFVLEVGDRTWLFAPDGQSVKIARGSRWKTVHAVSTEVPSRDHPEVNGAEAGEDDAPTSLVPVEAVPSSGNCQGG